MQTTNEYFNLSDHELLKLNKESGYTKEECLLFDLGLNVVFFDDEKEMEEEKEGFKEYMEQYNYTIKTKLITLNERIAVVLI